jgi:poly(A) polymerase
VPLLSGDQITAILDIPPGPELGRTVEALTEAQVRGEVRTAAGARRWLKSRAKGDMRP